MKKVIIPTVIAVVASLLTVGTVKVIKTYKELPTFDFSPGSPDPWASYKEE